MIDGASRLVDGAERPRAGTLLPLSWWHDPRWHLGSAARDLLMGLLSWSADHLADGRIPAVTLRMLAAATDDPETAVERLVGSGALERDEAGGTVIPADVCAVFNLSASQVEARRSVKAIAGAKGGTTTAQTTRPVRGPGGLFMGVARKQGRKQTTEAAHAHDGSEPPSGDGSTPRQTEARLPAPVSRLPSPGAPAPVSPPRALVADLTAQGLPSLTAEAIAALEERTGEPWSLAGQKQLGEFDRLVGAHGLEAVIAAFDRLRAGRRMTARQLVWPAVKVLEPFPDARASRALDVAEEDRKRADRVQAQVRARRVEQFRFTGAWDPAWGPPPAMELDHAPLDLAPA